MASQTYNFNIGLSDYAVTAYLSLLAEHPVNGSQLSRKSGIPRARIYDVLRSLKAKGYVAESSEGLYTPLPPEEMINRLRQKYETDLGAFESTIKQVEKSGSHDFIWRIQGYETVMAKASEMITDARKEIYTRMFPKEGGRLGDALKKADRRGVQIKYILMKPAEIEFDYQVIHPDYESMESMLGGRSFDLVVDRKEILCGMFEKGKEDQSQLNWGKNKWFVIAARDSLRHDFFHYFLNKTYDKKQALSAKEKKLYHLIRKDT
jgi:sugar-specific transcriptional regulator TrmB